MQWFWDDIRVESRTHTGDCEQEMVGKKALRLEQTAAGACVKRQGWDCIADYLEGGQSFTSPGASGVGGYNDMDCLVAFAGREICSDL